MAERPPSEIARETLKQFSVRRLPPTPENYRTLYDEIAGSTTPSPFPDSALRQIARLMPAQTPPQKRLLLQFEHAIEGRSWAEMQRTLISYANLGLGLGQPDDAAIAPPDPPPPAAPTGLDLQEQIARLVENALPAFGTDDARFLEQADQLIKYLKQPTADGAALKLMMGNLSFRMSFVAEEQAAIHTALLQSLQLVFRNIAELSVDERWLQGQVEALTLAATPPLSLRRLDDLQARLKDVIFKQSEAKARSLEAQEQVRRMLASFIERVSSMTEESGVYNEKMERCAELIGNASTLEEIAPVLQEVIGATRSMSLDSRRHRDDLLAMRESTQQAQAAVGRLQQELDIASEQARHDSLTGALNRKGLDEALEREIARARRRDSPLSMALLDIDDFKKINDRLGHDTGDAALQHLSQVIRNAMRPQDLLGRWGGEEFVLLLPDTDAEGGLQAMQRLQRELTRRFFLKDNEKVLITFSAGVTQLVGDEPGNEAIRRADAAMYVAKRAGKNRVMLG